MLFDDLCLKINFWPFLSYLASLKGLCPVTPPGSYSTTTLSPIPTFQPTPPTTLAPCPADPLVCLAGGERPIPYCPCIDPRQQNGQITTLATTSISTDADQISRLRLGLAYPSAVMDIEMMTFSHLDNSKRKRKRKKREEK